MFVRNFIEIHPIVVKRSLANYSPYRTWVHGAMIFHSTVFLTFIGSFFSHTSGTHQILTLFGFWLLCRYKSLAVWTCLYSHFNILFWNTENQLLMNMNTVIAFVTNLTAGKLDENSACLP